MGSSYPAGYKPQTSGGSFTRLTPGDHRLRIMSSPLIGYEVWSDNADGTRAVSRFTHQVPGSKEFNAFVVWNYQTNQIEILSLTQKGLIGDLFNLDSDPDWGELRNYDIVINRTGASMMDTRYTLTPKPAKPVTEEIAKALVEADIDLKSALTVEDNAIEATLGATKSVMTSTPEL